MRRLAVLGGMAGVGAVYYSMRGSKDTSIFPSESTTAPPGAAQAAAPCTTAANMAGTEKALDPNSWKAFKVVDKSSVTHNTVRLRAPLGDEKEDGSRKPVIRPYTPENLGDQKGFIDLEPLRKEVDSHTQQAQGIASQVVKGYPQGKMSKHMVDLQPGDELEFKGPIAKLPYTPNMKQKLGMIAGGSGLTPMLQVIKEIVRNPEDRTQINFIYANQSVEDIILKNELDDIAAKNENFNIFYLVDKAPQGKWDGGVGYLTQDIAKKQLPEPSDDNLILVCGPPPMMKAISGEKAPDKSQGEVSGLLGKMGYTTEQLIIDAGVQILKYDLEQDGIIWKRAKYGRFKLRLLKRCVTGYDLAFYPMKAN